MATVECIACGHVGLTKTKGSFAITIILLFFGFIPGLIYEVWRRSGGKVCSACGSQNVKLYIPVQRVVQQPIIHDVAANPVKTNNETRLVAQDAFSHHAMQGQNNILSDDELRRQELRKKNQAFINKTKKSGFNFAKLLFVVFALVLGGILGLIVNTDNTNSTSETSASKAANIKPKEENKKVTVVTSNYQSNQTPSTSMSFNECKGKALSAQLAVAGTQYKSTVLVDSSITYITRVCTNDGSVLITCSAPDQKMITTRSYDCPL